LWIANLGRRSLESESTKAQDRCVFASSELSSFAAFALNRGLFSCICNINYPDKLRVIIEQEKIEDG
jgi:hypothetical protein